jgi:hypothetical protein
MRPGEPAGATIAGRRQGKRLATAGPPSNLMPLDVERTIEEWRRSRA